jgi:hypothetical protein
MRIAAPTLQSLLETNVLEVKFTRRRPKESLPGTRRMLCTNSSQLLVSENGLSILHYQPAGGGLKYNAQLYNIVVAWDILKQDYRCISADDCELVTQLPADDTFWEYFNETILPMTPEEKINFMNS